MLDYKFIHRSSSYTVYNLAFCLSALSFGIFLMEFNDSFYPFSENIQ